MAAWGWPENNCVVLDSVRLVHRFPNRSGFYSRCIENLLAFMQTKRTNKKTVSQSQPKKLIDFWVFHSLYPVFAFCNKTLRELTLRPVEAKQNTFCSSLIYCQRKCWSIDDQNGTMRFTVKRFNRFNHAKRFPIIALLSSLRLWMAGGGIQYNLIWHPWTHSHYFCFGSD